MWMDRHDEANSHFLQSCEHAQKAVKLPQCILLKKDNINMKQYLHFCCDLTKLHTNI